MLKNKVVMTRIAICAVMAILVVAGTIFAVQRNTKQYTATEIAMEDLPESIKEKVEADIQEGGAYFYREGDDANTSYVALSFVKQIDMSMDVNITDIEDGLYFSISPVQTTSEDKLVYKLYETDAPSINTDKNILRNPRLVKGSVGINVGYLTPSETGYYIEPLEDDSEYNRLYTAPKDMKLEAGLYRYSFQLTQDGAELVAAAVIDQYSKMGYVSEINEDLQTAQVILVGEEKINYEMYFDANNAELASALQHMSEVGDNAKAMFVFHYNADIKSLQIDKCENVVEETHVDLDVSDENQ